jgi:hypothetical protein
MGVPTSEVGYTSATTWRGDHEVRKGHVVKLEKKNLMVRKNITFQYNIMQVKYMYTFGYATTNDSTINECYNEQFLSIKSGCYNEHRC